VINTKVLLEFEVC